MSPAPISRRAVMAGSGAALMVAAIPAGVVAAVAAEMPPTGLPEVFDPASFLRDLLDAGYRVTVVQSVRCGLDDDERRPSYFIRPPPGRGFGEGYRTVMTRWGDAMDACPDHVGEVVRFALGQGGDGS